MTLHSCTIVLKDRLTLTCESVEQSLGIIDEHGMGNINQILINADNGGQVRTYDHLSVEESIESLMSL